MAASNTKPTNLTQTRNLDDAPSTTGSKRTFDRQFADFLLAALWAYPVLWFIGLGGFFMLAMSIPSLVYVLRRKGTLPSSLSMAIAITILGSAAIGIPQFSP